MGILIVSSGETSLTSALLETFQLQPTDPSTKTQPAQRGQRVYSQPLPSLTPFRRETQPLLISAVLDVGGHGTPGSDCKDLFKSRERAIIVQCLRPLDFISLTPHHAISRLSEAPLP